MKILHLPTSVGGNSYGLSRAERSLGLTSDVLITAENYLSYSADIILKTNHNPTIQGRIARIAALLPAFIKIRNNYDIFHCNFGSSLLHFPLFNLPLLDIPFYPKKAKLIFTYNGCDARQKYLAIKNNPLTMCTHSDCCGGICNDGKQDKIKAHCIEKMNKHAHAIFAITPDLMHFLPERTHFLPCTIAGWNNLSPLALNLNGPLRIAHAPTNRVVKGSDTVFETVEKLQAKYGKDSIILDCIEGLAYEEALKRYAQSHIVIDQLRAGWYGALAVEAMCMGKPVLVYLNKNDMQFIPKKMAEHCDSAFLQANENTLYSVLEKTLCNKDNLITIRESALDFVHAWHDPVKIAHFVKEIYENS